MEYRAVIAPVFLALAGFVTLTTGHPFALPGGAVRSPGVYELPTCANNRVSPCKIIMANARASAADVIANAQNDRPICTCAGDASCPTGWDEDPDRTLSFYMKLAGRRTHVQYKFCDAMTEKRPCAENEIVASLGGTGLLPVELEAKNCQCNNNEPLHLAKIVTSGFRRRQDFVCSMPTCDVNRSEPQPCMTLSAARGRRRSELWEYTCDCPDNFRCTVHRDDFKSAAPNEPVSGFCRRV